MLMSFDSPENKKEKIYLGIAFVIANFLREIDNIYMNNRPKILCQESFEENFGK